MKVLIFVGSHSLVCKQICTYWWEVATLLLIRKKKKKANVGTALQIKINTLAWYAFKLSYAVQVQLSAITLFYVWRNIIVLILLFLFCPFFNRHSAQKSCALDFATWGRVLTVLHTCCGMSRYSYSTSTAFASLWSLKTTDSILHSTVEGIRPVWFWNVE